jgi:hypothetical protein
MKFLSLTLLLLVFCCSAAAFPVSFSGMLNNKTTDFHNFTLDGQLGSAVSVSAPIGTLMCLRKNLAPLSFHSNWNADTCYFYHNFSSHDSNSVILTRLSRRARRLRSELSSTNLTPGKYFVALATELPHVDYLVSLNATVCNSTSYGPDCAQNTSHVIQPNQNATFPAKPTSYFSFNVPQGAHFLSFNATFNNSGEVALALRAGNAPLGNTTNDFFKVFKGQGEVTQRLQGPAPGVWYGSVSLPLSSLWKKMVSEAVETGTAADETLTFSLSPLQPCRENSTTNPNCPLVEEVTHLGESRTYSPDKNQWIFFKVNLSAWEDGNSTYRFAVSNVNGKSPAPSVFARFQQIPSYFPDDKSLRGTYDAASEGNEVNSISIGQREVGFWYFGVLKWKEVGCVV